jgi:methylated-DNA-[protein]-cysteine S-methyltransferase
MVCYDLIPRTLVGDVLVAGTTRGLCAVLIGRKTAGAFRAELARLFPGEKLERNPVRMAPYRKELKEYFDGKRKRFTAPIDLAAIHSPFQRKVLRKLHALPFGRVVTYGELAARSGSPGAARAVGTAMARNPLAIVIPCHRVVAASGGLGGYSGGLSKKKSLLIHEGVQPTRSSLIEAGAKS